MARKKKEQPIELPLLQKPIGQLAEEAYISYGYYVNNHRHMVSVKDGLKDSIRRLIYSATQFPKGKNIPSTTLISNVANTHPHGLTGIEGSAACLVKSGIFSGEGEFGSTDILGVVSPWAAPRYTQMRLSDLYQELIGDLIKEVPYIDSPVGAPEPTFIPTILPLCLYMSEIVMGLGVGIAAQYPNFSPQSLYAAWKENNPLLLEPRLNLILDKNNSELHGLWNYGKGKVKYSYKLYRAKNASGVEGVIFEGDTGIFTPSLKKLKSLEEDCQIFMEDITDFNGPKLFIGKVPGSKKITLSELEKMCSKICSNTTTYNLNVTDGQSAFRIPLKDWLDYTIKNYLALVTEVNKKKIVQVKFQISVQTALPLISDYIINKNPKATDEEIMKALDLSEEVVKSVMEKPISWLRKNKDTTERVKNLKEKLKLLKAFSPVDYMEEIVAML